MSLQLIADYATSHLEDKVRAARSLAEVLSSYIREWENEMDIEVIQTITMQIQEVLDHMHTGMYQPELLNKGLKRAA